ncbi:MAG: DUF6133 family protein [Ruminococcus sp.]|nr:DUF6133 family protein [Ruminococcus sp.]MDD7594844.1 DUF6133 family protein [Clostridiales bacterium]
MLKVKSALSNKTGEGYIDTAVKMIIAVVLGSLLLTGNVLLLKCSVKGNQRIFKHSAYVDLFITQSGYR